MTLRETKIIQMKKFAKEVTDNLNGRREVSEILEAVFSVGFEHNMTNEDRNHLLYETMNRIQKLDN